VVDLSSDLPGGYCTKILADGGAEVVKVEDPRGDVLRRWSSTGVCGDEQDDGLLFRFVACSKRSVVVNALRPADLALLHDLLDDADAIVWSRGSAIAELADCAPAALARRVPHAVVTAITPFGLTGPWAHRPATDATLSAQCGGAGSSRGDVSVPPILAGGRLTDWCSGMMAALGTLVARERQVRTGAGELVDVSMLESAILTQAMYPVTYDSIAGAPRHAHRVSNLPNIHPTKDGYVGFMVVTGQQWLDFCVLVARPDWMDDPALIRMEVRKARRVELLGWIDDWTRNHTTDQVVELATLLRIPVAPVGNGQTIPMMEQFVERGWFVQNPRGGFLQPDVPYTLGNGAGRRDFETAPRLGEHTDQYRSRTRSIPKGVSVADSPRTRPFEGIRVADFTAFWAGPIVGNILGMFGADVIHVESAHSPDGMRYHTVKQMDDDGWWEWAPLFHGANTDKRDVTLDLTTEAGLELARQLIARSDVIVENYSPRVMESFGLDWPTIRSINPRAVFLRMPAYGTTGPWRDRVGYAQTIEMVSGLAWTTGFADGMPEIPNGPADPVGGCHATIALLLALEHRRRTGEGMLVECPQVGGALNIAAEQILEYSANGIVVDRTGNRSVSCAPQNLYLTADRDDDGVQDEWVCISVASDDQWRALVAALGSPRWASDPKLESHEGRRSEHDRLDAELAAWCGMRTADEIDQTLSSAGVPVGRVVLAHQTTRLPQLWARGFFEELDHPVTGRNLHTTWPAKLDLDGPVHRRPPPLLGQHNHEVLTELGLDDSSIRGLSAEGVIGTRAQFGLTI
jgi:crotonobetainyl-CoA:carnitine CoA-transferase CaiB-like acyl-CoA transferase